MNLKAKRIIAREVLILFGTIIVLFCTMLIIIWGTRINEGNQRELKTRVDSLYLLANPIQLRDKLKGFSIDQPKEWIDVQGQNTHDLYVFLIDSGFEFGVGYGFIPDFEFFSHDIYEAALGSPNENKLIDSIYNFLISKELSKDLSIDDLRRSLMAPLPPPPYHTELTRLRKLEAAFYLKDDVRWGILLVIVILAYPVRFVVLSIMWSIKTLRSSS